MSKRTPGLPQRPRGYWPTPREAVVPLIPYLPRVANYVEPCAGDGALIRHLADIWPGGVCVAASDIEPMGHGIEQADAKTLTYRPEMFITNPPWPKGGKRGDPAISIISYLMQIAPVWVLLPWDFGANEYFGRVSAACCEIVPVGRVSWMGNGTPGKDNAAWYRFDACNRFPTVLRARGAA